MLLTFGFYFTVSEWGEIMDEMSDRMAKQPSLIRKFAKER